jgi:DNA-binding XRE family transcriptional regulator
MWLSYHQLNRIERGEVAAPFLAALLFCEFVDLNPLWLALGGQESKFGFFIFQGSALQKDLQEHPGATFFEILSKHRRDFGVFGSGRVRSYRRNESPETLRIFRSLYLDAPPAEERKGDSSYAVLREVDLSGSYETGEKSGGVPETSNVNDLLTNELRFGKVGSMKLRKASLWPALRDRVLRLVRQRGMKSVLARDIGVSRQAINALISRKGTHGPSAEYALRLSKWVEIAEAQQKQSAGVSEAPARKTRR